KGRGGAGLEIDSWRMGWSLEGAVEGLLNLLAGRCRPVGLDCHDVRPTFQRAALGTRVAQPVIAATLPESRIRPDPVRHDGSGNDPSAPLPRPRFADQELELVLARLRWREDAHAIIALVVLAPLTSRQDPAKSRSTFSMSSS